MTITSTAVGGRGNPSTGPTRPLHPAFTHTPLGGLFTAAVLDAASAVDQGTHSWARDFYRAATFVLMISVAVMVVAIASGLVDRNQATNKGGGVRIKANRHGVVMAAVTLASMIEITLRRRAFPTAGSTPVGLLFFALVILAAAVVGGGLGGRLTYRAGVNVARPNSPNSPSSPSGPVGPTDGAAGTV